MTERVNVTDNPGKFWDIIMRRMKRGSYYHMPYFGCREFPAHFCLCEEDPVRTSYDRVEERDLGLMLYDIDYSAPTIFSPCFPGSDEAGRVGFKKLRDSALTGMDSY